MKLRRTIIIMLVFVAGIGVGGYLFSQSQPRSFLAIADCNRSCYRPSDLAGLLVSVGIQRIPSMLPSVEMESDKCVAIRHPQPEARLHYVLFPKRDIKNIGTVSAEDQPYVMGCFALIRELAERRNVQNYRLLSNGPALQHITYLHFHFIAR